MSRLDVVKLRLGITQSAFPDGMSPWFAMNDYEFADSAMPYTKVWRATFKVTNTNSDWGEYTLGKIDTKEKEAGVRRFTYTITGY